MSKPRYPRISQPSVLQTPSSIPFAIIEHSFYNWLKCLVHSQSAFNKGSFLYFPLPGCLLDLPWLKLHDDRPIFCLLHPILSSRSSVTRSRSSIPPVLPSWSSSWIHPEYLRIQWRNLSWMEWRNLFPQELFFCSAKQLSALLNKISKRSHKSRVKS